MNLKQWIKENRKRIDKYLIIQGLSAMKDDDARENLVLNDIALCNLAKSEGVHI